MVISVWLFLGSKQSKQHDRHMGNMNFIFVREIGPIRESIARLGAALRPGEEKRLPAGQANRQF